MTKDSDAIFYLSIRNAKDYTQKFKARNIQFSFAFLVCRSPKRHVNIFNKVLLEEHANCDPNAKDDELKEMRNTPVSPRKGLTQIVHFAC